MQWLWLQPLQKGYKVDLITDFACRECLKPEICLLCKYMLLMLFLLNYFFTQIIVFHLIVLFQTRFQLNIRIFDLVEYVFVSHTKGLLFRKLKIMMA